MTAVLTPLETRSTSHAYTSKGSSHFAPSLRIQPSSIILTSTKLKKPIRESQYKASKEPARWPECFARVSQGPQTLPSRVLSPLEPLRFNTIPPSPNPSLLQGFSNQAVPEAPGELL